MFIYTSGKMKGVSIEEYDSWRVKLKEALPSHVIYIPSEYYNYENKLPEDPIYSAVEFNATIVQDADIVIVKLDGTGSSIGTAMEVAWAWDHGVTLYGFYEKHEDVYDWCERMCEEGGGTFESLDALIEYINKL